MIASEDFLFHAREALQAALPTPADVDDTPPRIFDIARMRAECTGFVNFEYHGVQLHADFTLDPSRDPDDVDAYVAAALPAMLAAMAQRGSAPNA